MVPAGDRTWPKVGTQPCPEEGACSVWDRDWAWAKTGPGPDPGQGPDLLISKSPEEQTLAKRIDFERQAGPLRL